jgi:hypothetical protein
MWSHLRGVHRYSQLKQIGLTDIALQPLSGSLTLASDSVKLTVAESLQAELAR